MAESKPNRGFDQLFPPGSPAERARDRKSQDEEVRKIHPKSHLRKRRGSSSTSAQRPPEMGGWSTVPPAQHLPLLDQPPPAPRHHPRCGQTIAITSRPVSTSKPSAPFVPEWPCRGDGVLVPPQPFGRLVPAGPNEQFGQFGRFLPISPGEMVAYDMPNDKTELFNEDTRQLARDIASVSGANTDELEIIINREFPAMIWPPKMTETEAIELLRSKNDNPERKMTQKRLAALGRVEHALLDSESLQNAPIRFIAAGLFLDLDTGLFDNLLFRRVYIGDGECANEAARTDMQCARQVRIALSEQRYDIVLKKEPPVVRIRDAMMSLIHEMCHAYLRALCGWPSFGDIAYSGKAGEDCHGVQFGQVIHLVQKVLDYVNWNVDLGEDGRYPKYELVRLPC